jgi:hypothetical protein
VGKAYIGTDIGIDMQSEVIRWYALVTGMEGIATVIAMMVRVGMREGRPGVGSLQ